MTRNKMAFLIIGVSCLSVTISFVLVRPAHSRHLSLPLSFGSKVAKTQTPYAAEFEERLSRPGQADVISRRTQEWLRADGSRADLEHRFRLDGKTDYTERHIYLIEGVRASIWDEFKVIVVQREAIGNPLEDSLQLDSTDDFQTDLRGARVFVKEADNERIADRRAVRMQILQRGKPENTSPGAFLHWGVLRAAGLSPSGNPTE